MKRLFLLPLLIFTGILHAQTFTTTPTTANGTATPVLAWDFSGYTSCVASGGWTGTKAATGTQTMPTITATTTPVTTSYTLTCTSPASAGTVTLTWVAPTKNTDNSTLTNLAGYRIYQADTAANVGSGTAITINTPALTAYTLTGVSAGPKYFGMAAVNSAGVASALSNIATKNVVGTAATQAVRTVSITVNPPAPPMPPTGLTAVETFAYDVQRKYFGIFGPYVVNNRVGTVALGTACTNERIGNYNGVSRSAVMFTRSPRSLLIVAKCV